MKVRKSFKMIGGKDGDDNSGNMIEMQNLSPATPATPATPAPPATPVASPSRPADLFENTADDDLWTQRTPFGRFPRRPRLPAKVLEAADRDRIKVLWNKIRSNRKKKVSYDEHMKNIKELQNIRVRNKFKFVR